MSMYKAMIVEDEPILRRGLMRLVDWAQYGFSLEGSAANGREALQLAERIRPDLIVSDIRMPEMDGLEFLRALRERGYCCEMIFLTGYTDFEYAQTAIRLDALDYVTKLKLEEDLPLSLRRAAQVLDKRGMVEENALPARLSPAEQLKRYIDGHYAQQLSLSSAAEALGFNASYLSTAFSQSEGMTYSEYLTSVRMEHAKALLRVPGVHVADVAHQVGYPDERHFSRCFRAREGLSPGEFRDGAHSGAQ